MFSYSKEHKEYIDKIKRKKRIIVFFRCFILILFLIIWELLARTEVINTFLSSSPSMVVETTIGLFASGNLWRHILITLVEVLVSFFIAFVIGIGVASLLWSSEMLSKILDPYLTILNSLPKVALGPLIIIWFGASVRSIIVMSLMINIFVTIINIYLGFAMTNEEYIKLLKTMGASKIQIFTKVILPANRKNIINALKINISMSLIGVIMGELLVSKEGLGYLIMYGSQVFNINLVITNVVILGILSYLLYIIVDKIEKRYIK
ncbi:MAG: ABC transporter permease [Tenericutes bacterium]|nr:ABC transporter permease [Mycoplasmatota bacterium]